MTPETWNALLVLAVGGLGWWLLAIDRDRNRVAEQRDAWRERAQGAEERLNLARVDPLTRSSWARFPRRPRRIPWAEAAWRDATGWTPVPPEKRAEQERYRRAYESARNESPKDNRQ